MSGETRVLEVQIHPHHPSMNDPMSKLSLGSSSSVLHSSGGSTGEDSSGEEPIVPEPEDHLHRVVLGKKIRLKESNNNAISLKSVVHSGSLLSMICGGGGRNTPERGHEMELELEEDGEDDCSRSSEGMRNRGHHGGGPSTSGENSDAEGEDNLEDIPGGGGSHHSNKSGEDDSSKNCGRPIQCDVCNMRFSNGANMRRHRMRHSGIKPFECKICQKRFFRKDHLAEHMATHSKLLPFRCPICNKGFQRQIAMRAHFQNEHVGGSQDVVKACPLCAYKAGSMKSLRVHFYSRHGIDLDNPMPTSPSSLLGSSAGIGQPSSATASPAPTGVSGGGGGGEYSELAHALGFEDRGDKSSDSVGIPSHFLVPQIEISSNSASTSPYPQPQPPGNGINLGIGLQHHFFFSNPDSNYNFELKKRKGSPPTLLNSSPHSDSSSAPTTSSDLVKIGVKVKKELGEEGRGVLSRNGYPREDQEEDEDQEDEHEHDQDMPEDLTLSSGNSGYRSPETSPNCSSKLSSLKSLLREDWRPHQAHDQIVANGGSGSGGVILPRDRSDSSGHSSSHSQNQSCDGGDAITSSNNGPLESGGNALLYGRRGIPLPSLFCVYCGIIFPDKTLYFLHKGCHSDHNPWRCNICGELCNDVYDFNSHLLSKSHQ